MKRLLIDRVNLSAQTPETVRRGIESEGKGHTYRILKIIKTVMSVAS
jgi:hypothetical protein